MKILKTMKTRREETIESSTFDYIISISKMLLLSKFFFFFFFFF